MKHPSKETLAQLRSIYKPMLLDTSATPFDSSDWIFELKFDGFRAIIYIEEDCIKILSRQGRDITNNHPELHELKSAASCSTCILDGEIIALTNGKPDFNKLMRRNRTEPVQFIVFDILKLDGRDLTRLPLGQRKEILAQTVRETDRIVVSRFIDTHGIALFRQACGQNLEGIVAKHKNSQYFPGTRSRDWLKIKCLPHLEYVGKGRGRS